MNGGTVAFVHKKINVSVTDLNGSGRVFNFDLKARNAEKIACPAFFQDKLRVEVERNGRATIVNNDENVNLYPTGAMKKIVKLLGDSGALTLGYDTPDMVGSLERAGIPRGKDVAIEVWAEKLPKSESVLALVDDGK